MISLPTLSPTVRDSNVNRRKVLRIGASGVAAALALPTLSVATMAATTVTQIDGSTLVTQDDGHLMAHSQTILIEAGRVTVTLVGMGDGCAPSQSLISTDPATVSFFRQIENERARTAYANRPDAEAVPIAVQNPHNAITPEEAEEDRLFEEEMNAWNARPAEERAHMIGKPGHRRDRDLAECPFCSDDDALVGSCSHCNQTGHVVGSYFSALRPIDGYLSA